MRKLYSTVFVFLLFFACNNAHLYKITGQISSDSMEGQTVYLENLLWYMQLSNQKSYDSAVIHNKKFELKGNADSSYIALLTVNGSPVTIVFVENGNISVDIPDDVSQTVVTGTKLNDLFNLYGERIKPVKNKLQELMQYAQSQQQTPELQFELEEKYEALSKEILRITIKFLDENPGTILSAYLLVSTMSQDISPETISNIYETFDENVKNSVFGKIISKELDRAKAAEITAGEMFRDMTMKTPDDKDISISDYAGKGKYVLLDFWASWCGPCRAENPNVVALYKEYKDKDFEIIGVSLDNNRDAWIKGISDDGITWPQMSDLKGWDSYATVKYKVQSIPFTVLLDKEGKVIATNLRGADLKNKLETLINSK
ncbi:MAG: AhpC/TSA family protein [Prevotellaceae bacterium]|jgi:thiol-disulfide isomerase/thioredoxin|nr:AhpC/TSA family protein [Prevotellaceae bacterium]